MKKYEKPFILDEEIEVEDICLTSGGENGLVQQSKYADWFLNSDK